MFFALFLFVCIVIFLKLYFTLSKGINKCSKHLVGKVVIVTGGNSGIGFETAKDLAFRGAKVILACRNKGRGIAARDKIINETGNINVHYRCLDLASLASVRKFTTEFCNTEKRLDILINNAGIFEITNEFTEDGLSFGMQVNYFGPFLLTNLLLPMLKASAPSRIINVSSLAHRFGYIDFDNLNMEKESKDTFSYMTVYSISKLCNILMGTELCKRLEGTGVTINSLHPGAVKTNILKERKKLWYYVAYGMSVLFLKTAWEGAQTSIYLAVSPEVDNVSGCYFVDCKMTEPAKLANDKSWQRNFGKLRKKLLNYKK